MSLLIEINPCEDCAFGGVAQFPNVVSNLAYLAVFWYIPWPPLLVVFAASTTWHATMHTSCLWGDRLAIVIAIAAAAHKHGAWRVAGALYSTRSVLGVALFMLFVGEIEKHRLIPCTGIFAHSQWHVYSALTVYRMLCALDA